MKLYSPYERLREAADLLKLLIHRVQAVDDRMAGSLMLGVGALSGGKLGLRTLPISAAVWVAT